MSIFNALTTRGRFIMGIKRQIENPLESGALLGIPANKASRWRWGETNPVLANVGSATVIQIGDLVWLNTATKKVEPASTVIFGADLTSAQTTFALKFLGVDKNTAANVLENQTLIPVPTASRAIGRVAHTINVESGTVFVTIFSSVMRGGVTGAVIA